jgi:hypothetical protein
VRLVKPSSGSDRSSRQGNAARRALRDARVDPGRTVVLESEPAPNERPEPAAEPAAVGTARVLRYEHERVEIATEAPGARFLVLSDTDYPGWRAFVDGREARIHRANFAFRAVAVPAGAHRVVFSYEPASVRRGAWLSGLALAVVLLIGGDRRSPQAPPALGAFRHTAQKRPDRECGQA